MNCFDGFIRTGALGPIRVGCTQDAIRRALGPPEDVGNPEAVRWPAELWAYGGHFVQVFFEANRVIGLGLYFWHPPRLPAALGVEPVPFSQHATCDAISSYVADRKIQHQKTTDEFGTRITVPQATQIIFDEEGGLQKILAWEQPRG
jgi:hypothetical protein